MCVKVGLRDTCRCSVLWIRCDAAVVGELMIVLPKRSVDEWVAVVVSTTVDECPGDEVRR
jgi:hypothetical protein